jgi:hypothetical protein
LRALYFEDPVRALRYSWVLNGLHSRWVEARWEEFCDEQRWWPDDVRPDDDFLEELDRDARFDGAPRRFLTRLVSAAPRQATGLLAWLRTQSDDFRWERFIYANVVDETLRPRHTPSVRRVAPRRRGAGRPAGRRPRTASSSSSDDGPEADDEDLLGVPEVPEPARARALCRSHAGRPP